MIIYVDLVIMYMYLYIYISICLCLSRCILPVFRPWRSGLLVKAANGGKPPAGGSSPASKPRAPSEKRSRMADFPWTFSRIFLWWFGCLRHFPPIR